MKRQPPPPTKPTHYKVVCISIYTSDLEHADNLVKVAKAKGKTKMNRSELIRLALSKLTVEDM